jgi:hypothetical protein
MGIRGLWNVYGIDLPDEVLRRVYHNTAARRIHMEDNRGQYATCHKAPSCG